MSRERLEELQAQIKQLQQQATVESRLLFAAESKGLFEQFPEMESFGWAQYTPYYNDGEACYFSVNSYWPYINDTHEEEQPESLATARHAVESFLQGFSDDIMQDMFGDHVKVTVHRNESIEVDGYDHD